MVRDKDIDVVAGIMIIIIIIGHTLDWLSLCNSTFWQIILKSFFFFMPFFFFKSGMFFEDKDMTLKDFIKRIAKKLINPFFYFGIISIIIAAFRMYSDGNFSFLLWIKSVLFVFFIRGSFYGNSALWFLLTLFIVKILYKISHKYFSDYKIILIAFSILTLNHILKQLDITSDFYLSSPNYLYNSVSGIMFYSLGHIFANKQYKTNVFLISICIYVLLVSFAFSYVDMFHNKLIDGYYFIYPILSLCGIICLNNIVKYISFIYSFPILQYIGRNSFVFFATHIIIGNLDYILIYKPLNIITTHIQLAIYIISYIIFLPLLSYVFSKKSLKFIIGK